MAKKPTKKPTKKKVSEAAEKPAAEAPVEKAPAPQTEENQPPVNDDVLLKERVLCEEKPADWIPGSPSPEHVLKNGRGQYIIVKNAVGWVFKLTPEGFAKHGVKKLIVNKGAKA